MRGELKMYILLCTSIEERKGREMERASQAKHDLHLFHTGKSVRRLLQLLQYVPRAR